MQDLKFLLIAGAGVVLIILVAMFTAGACEPGTPKGPRIGSVIMIAGCPR